MGSIFSIPMAGSGNTIAFPGLGIDGFNLNPVAFTIFGHDIMWYGIILTLAMVAGFFIAMRNAKIEGIKSEDVMDLAIWIMIFSVVGARLYYVLMTLDRYDSFLDVIAVWNGGLAVYGGIMGGVLALLVVTKIKKISPIKTMDMIAPGLFLGQCIGRWGNFCNAEAHGVVTELPWRMGIQYAGTSAMKYYHPTFLYESLWTLLGFTILMLLYKKKKYDGQHTLFYITWYGFGRFFIEGLRTDSLYIGPLRVSQVVAAICVVVGIVLFIVNGRRARYRALDHVAYDRVYTDESGLGTPDGTEEESENFSILPDSAKESEPETEMPADAGSEPQKEDN